MIRSESAQPSSSERGFALLLTLWIIVLVTVIATQFAFTMRTEINIAANYKAEVEGYYYAYAGIQAALAEISAPYVGNYLSSDGQIVFLRPYTQIAQGQQGGETTVWQLGPVTASGLPDRPHRDDIRLGNGTFSYTIVDEDGKFNLNAMMVGNRINQQAVNKYREILSAIGLEAGESTDILIDSLLDWMDSDEMHRMNGAEDEFYEDNHEDMGFPYSYKTKNSTLEVIDELLMVRGYTPELIYGSSSAPADQETTDENQAVTGSIPLASLVSVHVTGTDYRKINKNTAPPILLSILFQGRAQTMIENRESNGMLGRESSSVFTIQARGRRNNSGIFHAITVVAEKQGNRRNGGVRVKYWKDDATFLKPGERLTLNLTEDMALLGDMPERGIEN